MNEERLRTGRGTEERVMQSSPALRTRLISRQTELQTAFAPFFLSNIFHTLLPRKLRELPAMSGKRFLLQSSQLAHACTHTEGPAPGLAAAALLRDAAGRSQSSVLAPHQGAETLLISSKGETQGE